MNNLLVLAFALLFLLFALRDALALTDGLNQRAKLFLTFLYCLLAAAFLAWRGGFL